jgi:hypothetical protein
LATTSRLTESQLPADASKDDALLAWLASRSVADEQEFPVADFTDASDEAVGVYSTMEFANALDLAFESLGV